MIIGIDGRELERGKLTGIGRYLLNFLKYATDARKKHRFILYGNQFTNLDFKAPNLIVKIIPERATITWDQIILPAYLKADRVDIFLSPYIKAPLFSPCPFITTIHDLLFFITPDYTGWKYKLYNELFKIFGKIISKKAATIITVSEHSKRDIIKIFNMSDKKIHVVPHGITKEYRRIMEVDSIEEIKHTYGIEGRYILYVGNFNPHKNIKRLIEAFADVKNEFLGLNLVLGGKKDKYVPLLKKVAEKFRIMDKVIFTDFIRDEDLPYLYNGAELFIYPSLYEGFGLPVLEAMACGTPVICSKYASLPEVVGDAGILVDTDETNNIAKAITELLKDKKQCEILKEKGFKRANEFTIEKYSLKILSLIESTGSNYSLPISI